MSNDTKPKTLQEYILLTIGSIGLMLLIMMYGPLAYAFVFMKAYAWFSPTVLAAFNLPLYTLGYTQCLAIILLFVALIKRSGGTATKKEYVDRDKTDLLIWGGPIFLLVLFWLFKLVFF